MSPLAKHLQPLNPEVCAARFAGRAANHGVCSPGSPRLPLPASKRKASRLGADGPAVKNKSALSRLCSTIIAMMSSSADLESLQMIGLQLSPESAGRVAKVRAVLGLIDPLPATSTHAISFSLTLSFRRPWPVAPSWGA